MNLSDLAANVLQQRSTPDRIADALREAILRGTFEEGQSLRQDEIAAQFGVSRIPVREALRQLEAEGLVTIHLNKGAIVAVLSPSEVQELCEIRASLEATALQIAIPKLLESDFEKAAATLAATDQAADAAQWSRLNWEFHSTLYTPADRPRLLGLIKTLHINIDRYVRLQMEKMHYLERSQTEHYQILAACRQRNGEAATQLLKQHIDTAGQELVRYLQLREQAR